MLFPPGDITQPPPKLLPVPYQVVAEAEPIVEKILIRAALSVTEGKRQEAAKLLGLGRNTLTKKLVSLGIENFND